MSSTDRLFEQFDDKARRSSDSTALDSLIIRHARLDDAGDLGRIFADREGGDPARHAAAFSAAIAGDDIGHTLLILVAKAAPGIIGYGKARYRDESPEPDGARSPAGWYLTGVVVDSRFRRQGVGARLTAERLLWISQRSRYVYYFSNVQNRVSIALHRPFGFVEVDRAASFAGVSFTGGEGILFRADLAESATASPPEESTS
jgi:ribosomal protein S18 acetylase RimI-like enzyme